MIHETEQDYKLEIRDSQTEQRNLRLQRLRESQSIRIQAETKQQRHDRLQITRDNTARRTTKLTPTATTKCCYVQREREATTSTDQNNRDPSFQWVEKSRTAFLRT